MAWDVLSRDVLSYIRVCQADAEKCISVWTILSQTPQVTYDAVRISARIF